MSGPLEGVVVLDLGQYLAGPYGPMLLADLGANVIKVEPVTGDAMRMAVKAFLGCQRGKRSVALDLKRPEGRDAVLRLAERSDVVHHNMTKGVADRLGIGYEALRERNPSLVHCNTWAYGAEGPLSDFGGLDPLFQAASGMEHEAGAVPAGNPPLYLRFGVCDTGNAMLSVVGVLAALLHERRTGAGQHLWTSLLDAGALFTAASSMAPAGQEAMPSLDAAQLGLAPGYRLYETQDGWVQLAAVTDDDWLRLCEALGLAALASDPMASDREARLANRDVLEAELARVFRTRTARAWSLLLGAASVPCEQVLAPDDGDLVLYDADNVALGLVTDYEHGRLGRLRQFGDLFRFSRSEPIAHTPPPLVGEHTREILAWAGYDHTEIDALLASGVAYEPDDEYRWSN